MCLFSDSQSSIKLSGLFLVTSGEFHAADRSARLDKQKKKKEDLEKMYSERGLLGSSMAPAGRVEEA